MKAKLSACAASALVGFVATALALSPQILSAQDPQDGGRVTQTAGLLPDGKGDRPIGAPPKGAAAPAGLANTTGNGIDYHGGPVMLNTVHMYYIWYGTWDAPSKAILTNFANGIGGSPYFNINTTYFDSANNNVSNLVTYAGSTVDNYSRGTALGDDDISTIVQSALTSGRLPTDTNGVYFVLTSPDVTETSGFTTIYCAWHTWNFLNGANIKYAFVGNASQIKPTACEVQITNSPNGNPGVDGMVSLVTHEFEESVTDPNLNAWWDSNGEESADKCAWTFGSVYLAANGSYANVNLGGHDFLIQQQWVNASGGYCALSYASGPDFSIGVAPTPQSVAQGGTTGNYTVTVTPVNSFTGSVSFTLNGLPSGATANPNPPASSTTSSSFTITTLATLAPGTYPFTITGTNASLTHTINASLVVTAPPPDFSIAVAPTPQTVVQGATTGNYTVTVTPVNSFTGSVSFTLNGLPTGATANPNPPASSTTSSSFTITTLATLAPGTYPFTITGTNASLSHPIPASLVVTAAPNFSISVAPTPQTVVQGGTTGSYTITVTPANGFTGSVGFTVSGLPTGASTNPNPLTGSTTSSSFTITTLATLAPGTYPFTITGTNASLIHAINASLIVTAVALSGSLQGSATSSAAAANLTTEGPGDWMHWGDSSLSRKAGVAAQLSNYTIVGGGSVQTYANDPRPLSWTDGTPTASSTNNLKGIYINGTGKGFSITAPADTNSRTLIVHAGGWNSAGTLTAHLSDNSATDFTNTTSVAGGQYDRNYTLTYAAGASGQNLTVTWKMASGSGNVTLNGAALTAASIASTSIAATGGASQSTAVGTAFVTGLQATVKDAGNNPVSGASVTFTAPGTGASGTFLSSGTSTVTVSTDVNGVASAPTLTANTAAGSYTVSASTPGTAASAGFSLTNQPGPAATVAATGGTPQSTTVNAAFANPLAATVKDASGNLVTGAPVTFTAPSSGASGAFAAPGGAAVVTVTVNSDSKGVATAPAFTANGASGSYTVVPSTPGASTTASFSLTNQTASAASVTATGGTSQSVKIGTAFVSPLVATVKDSGGNPVSGAPVTFTAPSTGASGTFTGSATVTSDVNGVATAPAFTANSVAGSYNVVASTPGAATSASFGLTNLVGSAASVTVTSGSSQSTKISTAFASPLVATVKDSGGNLVSGAPVTFTAPGSGASGTFSGSATVTSDVNGVATAPAFTANTNIGSYNVVASTPGASSASFTLTNQAGSPASVTANSGSSQSAKISTAFASPLVATVRDSGGNLVSGAPVTFAAPGSGASGTFSGSATVTSDVNGVATAPAFTANMSIGSYNVVASTPGAATSASFTLTNLVGSPAGVTVTSGSSQSTKISTAFASPLVATVKDSGGNLVSGAAVTFTAPGSGASGTFSGSATVTSDVNGLATAPAFTANTVAGSYNVVAGTPGAATSASFTLMNLVGSPASVTATGGASQSATVNSAFATLLVATVKDSGGNLVSGATVTFTAPLSGAGGTFTGGSSTASVVTLGNGTATAPAFTANGTSGSYAVMAAVSGVPGSASFSLTNNAVVSSGLLSGVGDSSKTGAVLSTEGGSDWVHWGDASLNRKAGVTALIGNYTAVGGGAVQQYSNDLRPLSWTGGAPTAASTNNLAGIYTSGTGRGFSITAPADSTTRTIVVHLGGWNSGGTLTAHLSDGSAVDFTDTTATVGGQYDRNYTLTYRALTAGQTLTVTWKMVNGSGNVTLNGAALQ